MSSASTAASGLSVEDQIAKLRESLPRVSAPESDGLWADVAERFRSLRNQYLAEPETLRARVSELAELRRQYDAQLDADIPRAIERYHALGEEIRRAEAEREFLRQFFVRRAGTRPLELNSPRVQLSVQLRTGLAMPRSGTPDRVQLDKVVQATGKWQEVSQLAVARLLRALEQKRFTPAQADEIDRLCPRTTSHVVRTAER